MNPHHKVPLASIISKSEVSIMVLYLLCLPCHTAVRIKNCCMSVIEVKNTMVPCTPVIVWNWDIHCPSLSAMSNSLHSSTNQELFEMHLCVKSSHYEKYRRFLVKQRKPSHTTTKLTPFAVSKDKWSTKEDTSKSLRNALHRTAVCQKAPLKLK